MPEQPHPLVEAITPLVERLNAELVAPADARADDIPLAWEGEPVIAVRLLAPAPASSSSAISCMSAAASCSGSFGRCEKNTVLGSMVSW